MKKKWVWVLYTHFWGFGYETQIQTQKFLGVNLCDSFVTFLCISALLSTSDQSLIYLFK